MERNRGCPISRAFFARDVGAMYWVQRASGMRPHVRKRPEAAPHPPKDSCFVQSSTGFAGSRDEAGLLRFTFVLFNLHLYLLLVGPFTANKFGL
jgi:hypothetical protein